MDNEKQPLDQMANDKDPLEFLRERAQKEITAPEVHKGGWAPREIGGKRKAWVIRGLIVFIGIVIAAEILFARKVTTTPVVRVYPGGPATQILVAQANQTLQPTPTVHQADFDSGVGAPDPRKTHPAPPTPTEPPLPEELQGIELPLPPDGG